MNIVLVLITATGLSLYVLCTIFVYEFLKRRNDKTPSYWYVNAHIVKNMSKYKKITRGEKRHTGPVFYIWIVSIFITISGLLLLFFVNYVVGMK